MKSPLAAAFALFWLALLPLAAQAPDDQGDSQPQAAQEGQGGSPQDRMIPEPEDLEPSRQVKLRVGQRVYVEFPGRDWIYLGETGGILSYAGEERRERRTVFTLWAEETGITIARFFREDALTNTIEEDCIEAVVSPVEKGQAVAVRAPPFIRAKSRPRPALAEAEEEPPAPQPVATQTPAAQPQEPPRSAAPTTAQTPPATPSAPQAPPRRTTPAPQSQPPAPAQTPAPQPQPPATASVPAQPQPAPAQTPAPQPQPAPAAPQPGPTAPAQTPPRPAPAAPQTPAAAQQPQEPPRSITPAPQPPVAALVPAQPQPAAVQPEPQSTSPAQESVSAPPQSVPESAPEESPPPEPAAAPPLEEEVAALYTQALEAFQAGKHEEALSLVNRFLSSAFSGVDRGLFLRGQILEAASPVQDIKGAYSSYETLVTLYPTSVLWGQAKNRITYLNRYYFEIW